MQADPKQRYQAIGDIRLDVQDYLSDPEADSAPTLLPSTSTAFWKAPTAWVTVAVAILSTAFATWFLKPAPDVPEPPLIRTTITADQLQQNPAPPVLSPDGRILVYGVADRLWIRYLDQFDPAPLPDSEGARNPFFSPDSQYLGYAQEGELLKVHLASNTKSLVCNLPGTYDSATWGADGSIVFGVRGGGLYQVSDQGGDLRVLFEGAGYPMYPHYLPGQKGILFNDAPGRGIHLLVDGKQTTLLSEEGALFFAAVYSLPGHLIYRRDGSSAGLHAVAFSLSSLQITGDPFLIDAEGVWPSVSRDGRLSYWIDTFGILRELVRVDRTGQVIGTIGQPQVHMWHPALSSDGDRVAVSAETNRDIWLHDVQRGSKTRLSSSPEVTEWYPAWTGSGDRVAFHRGFRGRRKAEIWTRPVDKSGPAKKLTEGRQSHYSSDGRFLVFIRDSEETGQDLWYLEVGQEGDPKDFLVTEQNESQPQLSPHSRWIAYTSDDSGQNQIYLKTFPSGEGLVQISIDGGEKARWSPDGDELFYWQGRDLMVVAVKGTNSLEPGTPMKLFTARLGRGRVQMEFVTVGYAVGEGGESFILVRPVGSDAAPPAIAIVHNWFSAHRDQQ